MARIFLDANFVVETIGLRKSEAESVKLKGHDGFISPLTIHIICYSFKVKVPSDKINDFISQINVVDITEKQTGLALLGPTDDFEDNIQLNSATEAQCKYFLTHDEDLLKMKFFGKAAIKSSL